MGSVTVSRASCGPAGGVTLALARAADAALLVQTLHPYADIIPHLLKAEIGKAESRGQ